MHSLKVLLIEPHPYRLMALHQMLNAYGVYDVRVAESDVQARGVLRAVGGWMSDKSRPSSSAQNLLTHARCMTSTTGRLVTLKAR